VCGECVGCGCGEPPTKKFNCFLLFTCWGSGWGGGVKGVGEGGGGGGVGGGGVWVGGGVVGGGGGVEWVYVCRVCVGVCVCVCVYVCCM